MDEKVAGYAAFSCLVSDTVYRFLFFSHTKQKHEGIDCMGKWNEQSAPNNNLNPQTVRTSKLVNEKVEHEYSEELSDGGERDQIIERQVRNNLKS
jgi:hypothetical protein